MVVVAPAASFHHTHHHHHHGSAASSLLNHPSSGGGGASSEQPIFPLLTTGPCILDPDAAGKSNSGIQFWQPQPSVGQNPSGSHSPSLAYLKKPIPMLEAGGMGGFGGGSSSGTGATCQDCGNQAKKDCPHHRCRTCCKSRGFDCSTHVKSTWVPAARRRERQQLGPSVTSSSPASTAAGAATGSASAAKKPRLLTSTSQQTPAASHTSTSNATTPRSFETTTSSHQDPGFRESLPRNVRAPAVFKCVRVTSIDDGEDEYAYQAMVTINGHVFKGFLYDQGVDDGRVAALSNEESTAAIPNISELHLCANVGRDGASSSSPMLSSDMYGGGGGGPSILGGPGFGNPMN